jgi:P27 family predicted phage terminase small subunit
MKRKIKPEDLPEAPEHLSERSKRIWIELVGTRALSVGRLTALQVALESLDRADEAREVVNQEGLTNKTKTTGTVHLHPLLKVEKDARSQFFRIWNQLGLAWDYQIDSNLRD